MRIEYIKKSLAEIESCEDDERAHALEDDLYEEVLRAIFEGDTFDSPADLAEMALKTKQIR